MNMSNISNDSISKLFGLDDYGYGDAAPDTRISANDASLTTTSHHKSQRRSSMKKRGQPRRSSIQYRDEVEYAVPGNRTIQRRNSIGFDNVVAVRSLAPILSEVDSPQELWFQKEDYNRMKERSFKLVELVQRYSQSGTFQDGPKKPCTRGLEGLMKMNEKIANRNRAYNSVLHEQEVQRSNGIFDDQALAESYVINTIGSKKEAFKLAKRDAKHVQSMERRLSRRS